MYCRLILQGRTFCKFKLIKAIDTELLSSTVYVGHRCRIQQADIHVASVVDIAACTERHAAPPVDSGIVRHARVQRWVH